MSDDHTRRILIIEFHSDEPELLMKKLKQIRSMIRNKFQKHGEQTKMRVSVIHDSEEELRTISLIMNARRARNRTRQQKG